MPLPKWSRRSVFQKLLILSVVLVILLTMFLTIGPMFVRNTMVKQTTDIYPSTDQEEMRIERNVKFYADSIQPETMFNAPLALKLIVPAEQREALLRDFRRNIRKRQNNQCPGPNCPTNNGSSVTPGPGSSTTGFGSSGSTAAGGSGSTTGAGGAASKSTIAASSSTPVGGSSSTGGASTGKVTTSSVPGGGGSEAPTTAATSKNETASKNETSSNNATSSKSDACCELECDDGKSKDEECKEKDSSAGCDCGTDQDRDKDDECGCAEEESKDDQGGCDCGDDDNEEWCKLDDLCTCVCNKKQKAKKLNF